MYDVRNADSPPPSIYFAAGETAADIMTRYSPENIRVTSSGLPGGTPAHYERLRAGEAELCNDNTGHYLAYHGLPPFTTAYPELRALTYCYPSPSNTVVRTDSGITKLEQLEGKTFSPGTLGSTTAMFSKAVFEVLGINPVWKEAGDADSNADVKDRRSVGRSKWAIGYGIDSGIADLMATTPLTLLGVTPEQEAKIKAKHPYIMFHTVPAGTFPGQQEDVRVWGSANGYGTTKDLPEEVGYYLFKALNEHFDELAAVLPALKGINPAEFTLETWKGTGIPLHAGAVRYLREKGYKVEDDLVPPEMK